MDSAYLTAMAALGGSIIGGFTSLAASWLSQNAQARLQRLAQDQARRRDLYKEFVEEASRLYADALTNTSVEIPKLVSLYAMVSRMRILSSKSVIQSAERVLDQIIQAYRSPNKTITDLHGILDNEQMDPLRHFSEACREDLRTI